MARGQNPVNADCNKLTPTKAVNHNQLMLTFIAKRTLPNITPPAKANTTLSMLIYNSPLTYVYG